MDDLLRDPFARILADDAYAFPPIMETRSPLD